MKKIYLFFCMLGIAVPYYHLFNYLTENNWYWSTSEFFELTYANSAVSMILGDLTVSVFAFFAFLIYKLKNKPLRLLRYIACLCLVGFCLALPLYLYDNHDAS